MRNFKKVVLTVLALITAASLFAGTKFNATYVVKNGTNESIYVKAESPSGKAVKEWIEPNNDVRFIINLEENYGNLSAEPYTINVGQAKKGMIPSRTDELKIFPLLKDFNEQYLVIDGDTDSFNRIVQYSASGSKSVCCKSKLMDNTKIKIGGSYFVPAFSYIKDKNTIGAIIYKIESNNKDKAEYSDISWEHTPFSKAHIFSLEYKK